MLNDYQKKRKEKNKKVSKALNKASKTHAKTNKNFKRFKSLKKGKKRKATKAKNKKRGAKSSTNPALYARSKKQKPKLEFKVYPSAYANAWLVRTYKENVVAVTEVPNAN